MRGLLSVHDVMPKTFSDVKGIISLLERYQMGPVTLLIVPGKEWKENEITLLKGLEKKGYNLAGHGWTHKTLKIKSFKHRIHSVVLSRNSAEHLSLKAENIKKIIQSSYRWFQDVGLKSPFLYVPPGWALGKVSVNDLRDLPFRLYETLTGLYDSEIDLTYRLPLIGFEADKRLRILSLRVSNSLNKAMVRISNRPVRIGIHPTDLRLGLASSIFSTLKQCDEFVSYKEVMGTQ